MAPNFAQLLRRSSRRDPGGTALLHGERRVDYLALEMAAQRIATILVRRYRVAPGDRIAVLLPDTPEFAFAAYGILWAGAVLLSLPPHTEPAELGAALTSTGAKLIIGWHAYAEAVEHVGSEMELDWFLVEPREFSQLLAASPPRAPLADVAGDAPAILIGSPPEPSELGHAGLAIRAHEAARAMGLGPGEVILAPPSLADAANQIGTLHAAIAAGAAVRLAGDSAAMHVMTPVRVALHSPFGGDRGTG